jgi:hypothetical protein
LLTQHVAYKGKEAVATRVFYRAENVPTKKKFSLFGSKKKKASRKGSLRSS